MKTRSFTILFFLLTCSVALFLTYCTKDKPACNKSTENNVLSNSDKSKVPYTGTDTLIFISNSNDTAICIGSGKVISQDCEDGGGSPDCPPFTYTKCYENNAISYNDKNKRLNMFLGLYGKYKEDYEFLVLKILNTNFYFSIGQVSSSTAWNYIPSISFSNKTYKNVSYAYKDLTDTSSRIYYSASNGIIRIEINNQKQTWALK